MPVFSHAAGYAAIANSHTLRHTPQMPPHTPLICAPPHATTCHLRRRHIDITGWRLLMGHYANTAVRRPIRRHAAFGYRLRR